jgi:hypothetical protein
MALIVHPSLVDDTYASGYATLPTVLLPEEP